MSLVENFFLGIFFIHKKAWKVTTNFYSLIGSWIQTIMCILYKCMSTFSNTITITTVNMGRGCLLNRHRKWEVETLFSSRAHCPPMCLVMNKVNWLLWSELRYIHAWEEKRLLIWVGRGRGPGLPWDNSQGNGGGGMLRSFWKICWLHIVLLYCLFLYQSILQTIQSLSKPKASSA
jgi:hypothetical protein